MSNARALFDAVIERFKCAINLLSIFADIVHRPQFETGIVKLQRNEIANLWRDESIAVASVLLED